MTTENRLVTLTTEEYKELCNKADFLNCLEACGVDNWGGYKEAYEMYEMEEECD